jgi:hypothetical protein
MRHLAYFLLSAAIATPATAAKVDDILAANRTASGGSAWNGKAALNLKYGYVGQGLTGKTATTFDVTNGRFVDTYDLGPVSGASGFDGAHGWAKDPSGTVTAQDGGSTLPISFNEAYRDANLWWRSDRGGAVIAPLSAKKSDENFDGLSVTPKNGQAFDAWFDRKTHLLSKIFEQQGSSPVTMTFSNYCAIDGVMVAGTIVQSTGNAKYDQVQTLTSAKFLPAQADIAFAAPKSNITDFIIAGGAREVTLPFRLINNHIYADVKVNGKGPYTFIFDTGGLNVVTPTLAKSMGLKIEGHVEARGAGSGTMEAGFTKVRTLELGAVSIKDQPFGAFPLDALSDVEGLDQSGMIGFETFRRFVTRIDYGRRTITLIDPKSFDAKDAGIAVPLSFDGNVTEVDATFDRIPGKFQLDTGARSALTLTGPFVARNDLRAKLNKGVEGVTGWGVGGATRSYTERAGTLTIGTFVITAPVVQLASDTGGAMTEGGIAGNIGAGILKRYVLTLDYGHNVVYFKPIAGPIADLDTFDRAGVWLNRDARGFKVIDVTARAPAAEAGLKPGDIVVSVDGKPATSIALYDLRYRLRNDAPGTHVSFTIDRKGASSEIEVTLRDLI